MGKIKKHAYVIAKILFIYNSREHSNRLLCWNELKETNTLVAITHDCDWKMFYLNSEINVRMIIKKTELDLVLITTFRNSF